MTQTLTFAQRLATLTNKQLDVVAKRADTTTEQRLAVAAEMRKRNAAWLAAK